MLLPGLVIDLLEIRAAEFDIMSTGIQEGRVLVCSSYSLNPSSVYIVRGCDEESKNLYLYTKFCLYLTKQPYLF